MQEEAGETGGADSVDGRPGPAALLFVDKVVDRLIVEALGDVPVTRGRSDSFGEEAVFDMIGVRDGQSDQGAVSAPAINEQSQQTHLVVSPDTNAKLWIFYIASALLMVLIIITFGISAVFVIAGVVVFVVVVCYICKYCYETYNARRRYGYQDID